MPSHDRVDPDSLEDRDGRWLAAVDAELAAAAHRAGPLLDFHRGCPTCCLGPFPINALDVRRLRRGLSLLARVEPARAAGVRARAAAAVAYLAPDFPGDPASGRLALEEGGEANAFYEGHVSVPCPVLDLASGRCELYAFRPLLCRTYGPPVRLGEEDLPPCQTCFLGSAAEADACRVSVDTADAEGALLETLAGAGEGEETLIAFALAAAP